MCLVGPVFSYRVTYPVKYDSSWRGLVLIESSWILLHLLRYTICSVYILCIACPTGRERGAERESSFEDNAIRRGVPVGRETTLPPSAKPPEERTWPQVTMLSFSAPDYTTSNYGDPLHTTHTIRMESRDQRPPNMTCTIRTLYIHVCVCGYARLPKAYVVHTHTLLQGTGPADRCTQFTKHHQSQSLQHTRETSESVTSQEHNAPLLTSVWGINDCLRTLRPEGHGDTSYVNPCQIHSKATNDTENSPFALQRLHSWSTHPAPCCIPGTNVPTMGGFSKRRVNPKLPNSPLASSSRVTSMVWAVSREYWTGGQCITSMAAQLCTVRRERREREERKRRGEEEGTVIQLAMEQVVYGEGTRMGGGEVDQLQEEEEVVEFPCIVSMKM